MTEKQAIARHYQELINQISSFESSSPGVHSLHDYLSQLHAHLNPDVTSNPKASCPGCGVSRKEFNHEVVEELPIDKKQHRRQKQIQKLRKIKKRTKKEENMLKKLLMAKNGYKKIICKICGYTVKLPPAREITETKTIPAKSKPNKQTLLKDDVQEKLTKKKERKKTAGLNPLYVRPKVPTKPCDKFVPEVFDKPKNVQKLSLMLESSKDKKKDRLQLLLLK